MKYITNNLATISPELKVMMQPVSDIDAENFIKIDTPVTLDINGIYPEYKRRKEVIQFEKTDRPVQEGDVVLLAQQLFGNWVYSVVKVPANRYVVEEDDGIYYITDTVKNITVGDDVHADKAGWEDELYNLKAKCEKLNLTTCC